MVEKEPFPYEKVLGRNASSEAKELLKKHILHFDVIRVTGEKSSRLSNFIPKSRIGRIGGGVAGVVAVLSVGKVILKTQ
jgi:heterodisulfide reductase subunit A-like polyferredoxin